MLPLFVLLSRAICVPLNWDYSGCLLLLPPLPALLLLPPSVAGMFDSMQQSG